MDMRHRGAKDRIPWVCHRGQEDRISGRACCNQINGSVWRFKDVSDLLCDRDHFGVRAIAGPVPGVGLNQSVHHFWMNGARVVGCKKHLSRLLYDIIFPIVFVDFEFWHGAALHCYARFVDCFAIAGNERMPVVQFAPFVQQPIAAGFGEPIQVILQCFRCQNDALWHKLMPDWILRAKACVVVEQAAGDTSHCDFSGVFVFEFVEAAFAAAVAHRFPLGLVHLFEFLGFPEPIRQAVAGDIRHQRVFPVR